MNTIYLENLDAIIGNILNTSPAPTSHFSFDYDHNYNEQQIEELLRILEIIFENGLQIYSENGELNSWYVIDNYLKKCDSTSHVKENNLPSCSEAKSSYVPFSKTAQRNRIISWVRTILNQKILSHTLSEILCDYNLHNCYDDDAVLRCEDFVISMIKCLRKLEKYNHINSIKKYKSMILDDTFSKLDLRLISNNSKLKLYTSLPNIHLSSFDYSSQSREVLNSVSIRKFEEIEKNELIVPSFSYTQSQIPLSDSGGSNDTCPSFFENKNELRPINIVKCDDIEIYFDRKHSPSVPSSKNSATPTTLLSSNLTHTAQSSQSQSTSKPLQKKRTWSILPFFDDDQYAGESSNQTTPSKSIFSKSAPSDFVNQFIPQAGIKIDQKHRRPIPLDSADSNIPYSSGAGFFPKPMLGQSLASFLQTAQFSRTNAEIERENAHFSVAEAMISAFEQIKWRNTEKRLAKSSSGSDVAKRKSKLKKKRLRTWINDIEKCRAEMITMENTTQNDSTINPHCSMTSPTISSSSTFLDSSDIESVNNSSDDEIAVNGNIKELRTLSVSTLSMEDHVAYAEWGETSRDAMSAEGVALSLISKFSDKHLPKASDLKWLVSEQDVAQQLLPMPGSWVVNPDDNNYSFLRGTRDWAPPRAQIIFTRHPKMDRKKQIHQQNYRCAGCGMRVARNLAHRFRYCEYLGKYLCSGCHRSQISPIPSRILHNWDFSNRPVCGFSYQLINQIWTFPLFRVCDLNPALYRKIRIFRVAYDKRLKLKQVKSFIILCRFANEICSTIFDPFPSHLIDDVEIWSISDFVDIRHGTFVKNISNAIAKSDEHILKCELCLARGFICEMCPKKQIIFPWQKKVVQCEKCGSCYHDTCFTDECSKCLRIQKRAVKMS